MTKIEQCFGKGVKYKDLTKEQRRELVRFYNKDYFENMSDEERKAKYREYHETYRANNLHKYREYVRDYHRERKKTDPEFKERLKQNSKRYKEKKNRDINDGD